jgi:hypothetical protein
MVCARFSNALSEVAAGGRLEAALDAHLAGCAHCTKELAALRQLLAIADDELRLPATVEPSASFVPRIRAAVLETGSAPARHPLWLWPSLATAAALVMTIILFVAVRSQHQPILRVEKWQPPPAAQPAAALMREPASDSKIVNANDAPVVISPRRTVQRRVLAEPAVLVPAGESRALVEFIDIVNRQKVASELLRTSDEPSAELAALTPITVKPIEIVPLDSAMNIGT